MPFKECLRLLKGIMANTPEFPNLAKTTGLLLFLWSVRVVYQSIQRLYFSPIAKFPGPKLAALTYWYEIYYDLIKDGQYVFKIKQLHEEYGPVIRINPHELHVVDPEFFHVLYASGGHKRNRDPFHTRGFTVTDSMLSTVGHDLHRKRRAALSPMFSKQTTRSLLPLVQERVDQLIQRLGSLEETGRVVNLNHAFAAFTNDVVMEFCFGESGHRVEADDFDPSYYNLSKASAYRTKFTTHFPWVDRTVLSMPDWILIRMGQGPAQLVERRGKFKANIRRIRESVGKGRVERETIFHAVLSSGLPAAEQSDDRLVNEAITLIGAGSHTVAWALTVASYHILANPSILRKLQDELEPSRPAMQSYTPAQLLAHLEKLPYLTATIKEALRLSYGVAIRIARIAPNDAMRCHGWSIPAGTSVSMTHHLISHDERLFPDADAFSPERWLADPSARLDRYLVSFSGGSRICLGINLAWAELYLCMARVFSHFGDGHDARPALRLFETGPTDVRMARDKFFPLPEAGSQGLRVTIEKGGLRSA